MPPPAQERWGILAGIPKMVQYKEAKRIFPPGTDISVAYNELPRASVLTVPLHISFPRSIEFYPHIAAADRSGLLLLCSTHTIATSCSMVSYHICDARTGEVVSLCGHSGPMGIHGANVGLIVRGDGCVVAELQPGCDGPGIATLLCYKVGECKWVERELTCSPPLPRHWCAEGVVSHGGMLWWIDLSYGLLACDPFAEEPKLLFVPLPRVLDELPADPVPVNRGSHRCVKVSAGRLRYVQIHGSPDAPVVSTWALADWTYGWEWNPERSVALAEVWADQSYLDTTLPLSIPALSLLHPTDPDCVYFFLRSCIFAVDLRLRKVVGSNEFEMVDPPPHLKRSSHFVHAWQYDPSSNRSDFVSTCLRQEKAAAAQSRFSAMMPITPRIAKKLRRFWDSASRKDQQAMCQDFKRRCRISGEQNQPASRMNEG